MNVELTEPQKKWIAALRSGEFKQGKSYLRYGDLYCCLGVASEIFADELGLEREVNPQGAWSYDKHDGMCPLRVASHLRLYNALGGSRDGSDSLAGINDRGGSFSEIADLIETGEYFKPVEEST